MTLISARAGQGLSIACATLMLSLHTEVQALDSSLDSYEPNYFVFANSTMDGELKDETHAEFLLSIKYSILEDYLQKKDLWLSRVSFVYSGLYDFYMLDSDRYESAPIISRRQNPGIVFEFDLRRDSSGSVTDSLQINWFHESNGQSLDLEERDNPADEDKDGNGRNDGIDEFYRQVDIGGKEYALAQISRGWDYAELVYNKNFAGSFFDKDWYLFEARLRFYCDCQAAGAFSEREDRVFWEPVKEQPKIGDFDGLRLKYEVTNHPFGAHLPLLVRGEFKTGIKVDKLFDNNSVRLSLNLGTARFWWSLFYFNGYGKEVSTYHLRTRYVGLGFEFR